MIHIATVAPQDALMICEKLHAGQKTYINLDECKDYYEFLHLLENCVEGQFAQIKKNKNFSEIFVVGCLFQLMERGKHYCNQLYDFDIKLFYIQDASNEHSSNMKSVEDIVINTINKERQNEDKRIKDKLKSIQSIQVTDEKSYADKVGYSGGQHDPHDIEPNQNGTLSIQLDKKSNTPIHTLITSVQSAFDLYHHSLQNIRHLYEFYYVTLNGYKSVSGSDLRMFIKFRMDMEKFPVIKTASGYEVINGEGTQLNGSFSVDSLGPDFRQKLHGGSGAQPIKDKNLLSMMIFQDKKPVLFYAAR